MRKCARLRLCRSCINTVAVEAEEAGRRSHSSPGQRCKRLKLFDIHTRARVRGGVVDGTREAQRVVSQPTDNNLRSTPTRESVKKNNHADIHLHASCAPSGESTSAQHLHAQTNMGPIFCDLPRTWQPHPLPPASLPASPETISSPSDQIFADLSRLHLHIHLALPRVCIRGCADAHVPPERARVHFVRAAC